MNPQGIKPQAPPPVRSDQLTQFKLVSPLWVDANHQLYTNCWSAQSSIVPRLVARIILEDGTVYRINQVLNQGSTGARAETWIPLRTGYLVELGVYNTGTAMAARGMVYVDVDLYEYFDNAPAAYTTLVKGYLTAKSGLIWFGGRNIDSLEGPGSLQTPALGNPAAGADFTFNVSGTYRWRLKSLTYTLVTSATVATRRSHLLITDSTNTLIDLPSSQTQTAGLTYKYYWAPYQYSIGLIGTNVMNPLPADLLLGVGWQLKSSTDLIDATDQYSAIRAYVEQWIEGNA